MPTSQERKAQREATIAYLRAEIADFTKQLAWWEELHIGEQIPTPNIPNAGAMKPLSPQRPKQRIKRPLRQRKKIAPTEHIIITLLEEAGRPQTVAELKFPAYERGLVTSTKGIQGVRNGIASALARMLKQGIVTHNETTHRYGLPSWSTPANGQNGFREFPSLVQPPK